MAKVGMVVGSFDPLTWGHHDLIWRAAALVDKLYIAVYKNPPADPLFTIEERVEFAKHASRFISTPEGPNIPAEVLIIPEGRLQVQIAKDLGVNFFIKGIRNSAELEYEQQIATLNSWQEPKIETVTLLSKNTLSAISSTAAKQIAVLKGELGLIVPNFVEKALKKKFS